MVVGGIHILQGGLHLYQRSARAGEMKAVHVLDDVSADVYPLKEWNDALQYIVHGSAELTAEEARAALM